MDSKGQEFEWQEIKEIWTNSAQMKKINIQVSHLIEELKEKVSQFERDSIESDVAALKTNWNQFKGMTSQFEKDSIRKDLNIIRVLVKRFLNLFKNN